ncbi:Do family serine endopeptidase [Robiginitalea sp. M366]|uniref:Do family serine endopeptidase n=1 Tax=Robiginitalea aestuariiviva TaxID=3036903 RepID=UPI00240D938B|nr:Do family serine endopeptidase [Robiginitalea aestuariiviva]MDG1571457.1 Do family serine endopeptidase [Robiginitalea aestuariiviva]
MKEIKMNGPLRTYLFSGAIALFVSLGVIGLSRQGQSETEALQTAAYQGEKPVLYTADKDGNIQPLDFTKTTDKVLDAVVHVTSRASRPAAGYRQLPDPFREFFRQNPFQPYSPQPGQPAEPEPDRQAPEILPQIGSGSGVVINDKGYIVTNNHVIADAEQIEVTLHNNETYPAEVVGTDPTTDLALLKIDAEQLKPLAFVNSDDVEVGEWVLAIGNPFSLNSTVTAGIVSAKARNININREALAVESFIQTDAAINPGNSGGALVNLNGDLIGINTAIASRTGTYNGYGFAVPSNLVSKVVEDLLDFGSVQRGILGVQIQNMSGRLAREKQIEMIPGAFVAAVNENSAASEAGIATGDIITGVDDKAVGSSPRLQELIAGYRPGDKVSIRLVRDGKTLTREVVLKNTAGNTALVAADRGTFFKDLGAEFKALDPERAETLGLDGGVAVSRLLPGKLRQETRMRDGFIITAVNGKAVNSVEGLREALDGSRNGGVMLEGRYPDSPKRYYYAFGLDS